MKVIISHDIDHLKWSEHLLRDLYIPKFILKNLYYGISGRLPLSLVLKRLYSLSINRINRIDEINAFDDSHGVKATFFIGMANGLSLSYSNTAAARIIKSLLLKNKHVGIHGIAWDEKEKMIKEYVKFSQYNNSGTIGIRNHYLRLSSNTLDWMNEIGYSYDSTVSALKSPYVIGNMVEFPVCLMDVNVLSTASNDLEGAKEKTKIIFEKANELNLSFFTIIFHDNYFSDHYPLHMKWYKWLIPWIIEQGHEFVSFKQAIKLVRKAVV